jgi:GDP/UDP-N,N'-diacetylbacillosamine 2-epimerase (hydrolysing)
MVVALGDRYEMFAAVASSLPFNIKVAHIHGGETTLGAIDNAMRHSITHMSSLHFTATEAYKQRVIELTGSEKGVYNTGALSIDNLSSAEFLTKEEIMSVFNIDLNRPTVLITLHPESIGFEKNETYAIEMLKALENFSELNQVITMPNADTSGLIIRRLIHEYSKGKSNVFIVENFGSRAYLSVMKYCTFMLGNTSSGFIEAAYFPKWVINIGKRQLGRIRTPNIIDVEFDHELITSAILKALNELVPQVGPVYGTCDSASKILKIILDEYDTD